MNDMIRKLTDCENPVEPIKAVELIKQVNVELGAITRLAEALPVPRGQENQFTEVCDRLTELGVMLTVEHCNHTGEEI